MRITTLIEFSNKTISIHSNGFYFYATDMLTKKESQFYVSKCSRFYDELYNSSGTHASQKKRQLLISYTQQQWINCYIKVLNENDIQYQEFIANHAEEFI